MKAITRVLFHPITICFLFCFLLISGELNAAFYIFILLLGLPHGVLHSLLGIIGIILMMSSLFIQRKQQVYSLRIFGAVCFLLSLIRFFTQPGGSYNYPTFHQSVPLIILSVFLVLLMLSIISYSRRLMNLRHSV